MTADRRTDARLRHPLLACLATLALVLGACSSGGDDSAEVRDDAATEQDDASTTEAGDDEGDEPEATEPDDTEPDAAEVTVDDLEALLPTAADIGPDYAEEPEEDETGDDEENPLDEACPAVAALAQANDDSQTVTASFAADDERSIEVDLNAAPPATDAEAFDERIDALNSCGTIAFSEGGFDYEVTVTAERDDSLGDVGATITGTIGIASPQLSEPAALEIRMHVFIVGDLGASVEVTSGLTQTGPDTLAPVPGDFDLLGVLGPQLETALADLQG